MKYSPLSRLKTMIQHFIHAQASERAASITFFTLLSLPAVFSVSLWMLAIFVTEEQVERLWSRVSIVAPSEAIQDTLNAFFENATVQGWGFTSLIAVIVALFAGSRIFTHLAQALGEIWGRSILEEAEERGGTILRIVLRKLYSIIPLFILGAGLLLLVLLGVSVNALSPLLGDVLHFSVGLIRLIAGVVFILGASVICGLFFVYFSDRAFSIRGYVISGLFTALLIAIGQFGLGWYFRWADVTSGFGALGSAVALLVWMYYTSSMFLFGATMLCVTDSHKTHAEDIDVSQESEKSVAVFSIDAQKLFIKGAFFAGLITGVVRTIQYVLRGILYGWSVMRRVFRKKK